MCDSDRLDIAQQPTTPHGSKMTVFSLWCGKVHYRQVADMCKIQIQITHTARSVAHRLFPTRPVCLPACLPHKTPLSITYQIVMICAHYCASVYCIIIVNNNRSYHIAHRDSKNAAQRCPKGKLDSRFWTRPAHSWPCTFFITIFFYCFRADLPGWLRTAIRTNVRLAKHRTICFYRLFWLHEKQKQQHWAVSTRQLPIIQYNCQRYK